MRGASLLVLALLPTALYTFPSNPGPGACVSFVPSGHTTDGSQVPDSQEFPSIYSITMDTNTYSPGQEIKVTLTSQVCGRSMKGFLVQARPADPSQTFNGMGGLGNFINFPPGTKEWCSSDNTFFGASHSSRDLKESVELTWKAPATASGHIVFVATFVESTTSFWVKQRSAVVRDSSISSALSYSEEASPVKAPISCGGLLTKPSGCGSDFGCFADCTSAGCSYIVTWLNHDDHVMFTAKARFPGIDSGYIAVGLSNDKRMGSDGVTECVYLNSAVTVLNSENTGRSNKRRSIVALEGTGSYRDGTLECSYEIPKSEGGLFDVDKNKFMLFVKGTSVSADNLSKHTSKPVITSTEVDFQSNKEVSAESTTDMLVKIHGSLMVGAWIFAASIGIVIARYFKPQWPDSRVCGEKAWFQMHRGFMMLTFAAAVSAFVIIFVDVQGYSDLGLEASKKAHPILGIIVTALMVINPIMAVFRPHPGDANRPIFNWAHFGVGTAAHILAVVTIFLGVNLGRPAIPGYVTWILIGYVAWQVLVEFLLVFVGCTTASKDRRENYELAQKGQEMKRQGGSTVQQSSPARQILLLVHVMAITGLATAVVICIVIS